MRLLRTPSQNMPHTPPKKAKVAPNSVVDPDKEFTVERIVCSRWASSEHAKAHGKLEYRVRWKGSWPADEKETWEPGSSLVRLARF